jgi:hypothetical protein
MAVQIPKKDPEQVGMTETYCSMQSRVICTKRFILRGAALAARSALQWLGSVQYGSHLCPEPAPSTPNRFPSPLYDRTI